MDEARLAAIQAAAEKAKNSRYLLIKRRLSVLEAAADAVPELLAHVGVLRADNQRLRAQIERHQASGCHALPEPPRLPATEELETVARKAFDEAWEAAWQLAMKERRTSVIEPPIAAVVSVLAPLIRRQAFHEAEQAVRDVVGDCSGPEAFEVAILAVRGLGENHG